MVMVMVGSGYGMTDTLDVLHGLWQEAASDPALLIFPNWLLSIIM